MADKNIEWKVKIGSYWVSVSEQTFINIMDELCDHVNLYGSNTRIAVFIDKRGYAVGKIYTKYYKESEGIN